MCKKGRSRAHEGVAKVAVVGTILHFLREDVAGVATGSAAREGGSTTDATGTREPEGG